MSKRGHGKPWVRLGKRRGGGWSVQVPFNLGCLRCGGVLLQCEGKRMHSIMCILGALNRSTFLSMFCRTFTDYVSDKVQDKKGGNRAALSKGRRHRGHQKDGQKITMGYFTSLHFVFEKCCCQISVDANIFFLWGPK